MAAIPLTEEAVASVRQALERRLPKVGAAHLGEALARSLGHRTDTALRATLQAERDDPPITLLDAGQFRARLQALGYPPRRRLRFEHLHEAGLIATESPGPRPRRYSSTRARAWRNLMVCAINAGLAQKLFSLRADDNRWPGPGTEGCLFDFVLPNGWPTRGNVRDIGYAELSVRATVHPNGDWIRAARGRIPGGRGGRRRLARAQGRRLAAGLSERVHLPTTPERGTGRPPGRATGLRRRWTRHLLGKGPTEVHSHHAEHARATADTSRLRPDGTDTGGGSAQFRPDGRSRAPHGAAPGRAGGALARPPVPGGMRLADLDPADQRVRLHQRLAWVRDIVGGRTRSYEQTLEGAQGAAMQMLHQRCRARGATHAIGPRMDCEGLGPRSALIAVIITATLYRAR